MCKYSNYELVFRNQESNLALKKVRLTLISKSKLNEPYDFTLKYLVFLKNDKRKLPKSDNQQKRHRLHGNLLPSKYQYGL